MQDDGGMTDATPSTDRQVAIDAVRLAFAQLLPYIQEHTLTAAAAWLRQRVRAALEAG